MIGKPFGKYKRASTIRAKGGGVRLNTAKQVIQVDRMTGALVQRVLADQIEQCSVKRALEVHIIRVRSDALALVQAGDRRHLLRIQLEIEDAAVLQYPLPVD